MAIGQVGGVVVQYILVAQARFQAGSCAAGPAAQRQCIDVIGVQLSTGASDASTVAAAGR